MPAAFGYIRERKRGFEALCWWQTEIAESHYKIQNLNYIFIGELGRLDTFLFICINRGFRLGSSFEKKNQSKDPTWNENSNIGS